MIIIFIQWAIYSEHHIIKFTLNVNYFICNLYFFFSELNIIIQLTFFWVATQLDYYDLFSLIHVIHYKSEELHCTQMCVRWTLYWNFLSTSIIMNLLVYSLSGTLSLTIVCPSQNLTGNKQQKYLFSCVLKMIFSTEILTLYVSIVLDVVCKFSNDMSV